MQAGCLLQGTGCCRTYQVSAAIVVDTLSQYDTMCHIVSRRGGTRFLGGSVTIIDDLVKASEHGEPSHWQRRRLSNSKAIEIAALELILERGPEHVSIADIADRAGISRRTFFRYFRTRDQILAAMPARQMILGAQMVCERPQEETLVEAMLATARTIGLIAEEEQIIGLSLQVMSRFPEQWQRAVADLRRAMDANYEAMIRHRLAAQGLDVSVAPGLAAGLAAIVVHTYTDMVSQGSGEAFADRLERALYHFKHIGLAGVGSN